MCVQHQIVRQLVTGLRAMPHYVEGAEGKGEAAPFTMFLQRKEDTKNNFFFWAAVSYLWIFAFLGGLGTQPPRKTRDECTVSSSSSVV
jgi:hypothetical protein